MSQLTKRVVIVGGGSAGWICAGTLAAHHKTESEQAIEITLVESPNVPIIGVGEGTWPTMRSTLRKMGVSETDFFKECDASFKQGAKFAKWVTGKDNDFYYHPLVIPQGFLEENLAVHWLRESTNMHSFADAVCAQSHLCEQHRAPKKITTPEYASIENYAYHLDAGKFAEFIRKHVTSQLGVKHILADVEGVSSKQNGDIRALTYRASWRGGR